MKQPGFQCKNTKIEVGREWVEVENLSYTGDLQLLSLFHSSGSSVWLQHHSINGRGRAYPIPVPDCTQALPLPLRPQRLRPRLHDRHLGCRAQGWQDSGELHKPDYWLLICVLPGHWKSMLLYNISKQVRDWCRQAPGSRVARGVVSPPEIFRGCTLEFLKTPPPKKK